jgi:hypothetical protein
MSGPPQDENPHLGNKKVKNKTKLSFYKTKKTRNPLALGL